MQHITIRNGGPAEHFDLLVIKGTQVPIDPDNPSAERQFVASEAPAVRIVAGQGVEFAVSGIAALLVTETRK